MFKNSAPGVYGSVPSLSTACSDARVLIAEDEPITAADLRASLAQFGCRVVASVGSGEEAVEQAGQCRPDLVIMDVRLRGRMDGVEAGRRISESWNIPIIYVSAFLDSDIRERARESAATCLSKPFDPEALRSAVAVVFDRDQPEPAPRAFAVNGTNR